MFSIEDYHYHLPEQLIAQQPIQARDQSRLLVMDRNTGVLSHQVFHELESFLSPSDVLVVNNTQVIPGRIVGKKESGGRIEALVLNYASIMRSSAPENQFRSRHLPHSEHFHLISLSLLKTDFLSTSSSSFL